MHKPVKNISVQPNPVISHGVPAYSAAGRIFSANDGHYNTFHESCSPDYIAYNLSEVPESERETIIAVWYNESTYDNIGSYVKQNGIPTDYSIEVNSSDSIVYPEYGWQTVVTVTDNTLSSRQHIINMKGFNWVRMNISRSDFKKTWDIKLNLDIHDVSECLSDSWLFLGDSITGCGMNNCYGTGFASHIHNIDKRFFPIQENGGIGGISSTHGKENIDRWLSLYQGRFVSIAFGTNDAWGNYTGAEKYYENTRYMTEAVLSAGKIPVLPTVPYALEKDISDHLYGYNEKIKRLWAEFGEKIVHGVDLETFLKQHTEYLSYDGVHPTQKGYEAIRKFWAETMYETVYNKNKENYPNPLQKNTKCGII